MLGISAIALAAGAALLIIMLLLGAVLTGR